MNLNGSTENTKYKIYISLSCKYISKIRVQLKSSISMFDQLHLPNENNRFEDTDCLCMGVTFQ